MIDEHAACRVHAIHIDHRDPDHRERAIVQGVFPIGDLVIGRERIAIEVRARGLAATDIGVAAIGEREELAVAEREPGEVE